MADQSPLEHHSFKSSTPVVDCLEYLQHNNDSVDISSARNHVTDMAEVLIRVKNDLPRLLSDRTGWTGLLVDYAPPHLMRIYKNIHLDDGRLVRVLLHYFILKKEKDVVNNPLVEMQCNVSSEDNLYHPHPWASAMMILDGSYNQDLGFTSKDDNIPPQKIANLHHETGDSYTMSHPSLWHQVNPNTEQTTSTLMITYIPSGWTQKPIGPTKKLSNLNDSEMAFMFDHFSKFCT
jgi:hypothetical protein